MDLVTLALAKKQSEKQIQNSHLIWESQEKVLFEATFQWDEEGLYGWDTGALGLESGKKYEIIINEKKYVYIAQEFKDEAQNISCIILGDSQSPFAITDCPSEKIGIIMLNDNPEADSVYIKITCKQTFSLNHVPNLSQMQNDLFWPEEKWDIVSLVGQDFVQQENGWLLYMTEEIWKLPNRPSYLQCEITTKPNEYTVTFNPENFSLLMDVEQTKAIADKDSLIHIFVGCSLEFIQSFINSSEIPDEVAGNYSCIILKIFSAEDIASFILTGINPGKRIPLEALDERVPQTPEDIGALPVTITPYDIGATLDKTGAACLEEVLVALINGEDPQFALCQLSREMGLPTVIDGHFYRDKELKAQANTVVYAQGKVYGFKKGQMLKNQSASFSATDWAGAGRYAFDENGISTSHCTIKNYLVNVANTRTWKVIPPNRPYQGDLVPLNDCAISSVSITMNGEDITETAYNAETGHFTLTVAGDIIITAVATPPTSTIEEIEEE